MDESPEPDRWGVDGDTLLFADRPEYRTSVDSGQRDWTRLPKDQALTFILIKIANCKHDVR